LFEQAGGAIEVIGFERIAANKFGQMSHFMGWRKFLRFHFAEMNSVSALQELPCRFATGKASADYYNRGCFHAPDVVLGIF
jgi:hypothetical protein